MLQLSCSFAKAINCPESKERRSFYDHYINARLAASMLLLAALIDRYDNDKFTSSNRLILGFRTFCCKFFVAKYCCNLIKNEMVGS